MPGKGTIDFDVLCSTDEIENLCTVQVTASKAGTDFDKSFDFAPGTTSTWTAGPAKGGRSRSRSPARLA
jgi:hypothetical protein